jgi:hypothetical protein
MKIRMCNLKNGELINLFGSPHIAQVSTDIKICAVYEFEGRNKKIYKKTGYALTYGLNCRMFVELLDND